MWQINFIKVHRSIKNQIYHRLSLIHISLFHFCKIFLTFYCRWKSFKSTFDINIWTMINDISAGIYLLKVNNRNTSRRCEICSKLTIKTPERGQWRRSGVLIVSFEYISLCSRISIVNFEHVIASVGCECNVKVGIPSE